MSSAAGSHARRQEADVRWLGAYEPLVPVLGAFAAGIVIDRYLSLPVPVALLVGVSALVLWRLLHGCVLAAGILLLAVASLGAAHHHLHWALFSESEIGFWAGEHSEPVAVEVIALNTPRRLPAPAPDPFRSIPQGDRSRLVVKVAAIRDGDAWSAASGTVELVAEGHLTGIRPGDRLRVFALLRRPARPKNPGETDWQEYYRRNRQLCQLRVTHPACVQPLETRSEDHFPAFMDQVRRYAARQLETHLDPEASAVARAMLLGSREQLTRQQTDVYLATGTMHVLCVSGLHLGILVGGFWMVARVLFLPRTWTLALAMLLAVFYAMVAEAQPPVVRAAALVVTCCAARLRGSRPLALNTLAAAGLIVLIMNPAWLFQVGTQLSFLAVSTLIACRRIPKPGIPADPLQRLVYYARPRPLRVARAATLKLLRGLGVTGSVWFVTQPLVAYHFHVFSPVAIVLNPLISLPAAGSLYGALGAVLFADLCAPLARLSGAFCQICLQAMQWLVVRAEQLWPLQVWVPAPSSWWGAAFLRSITRTGLRLVLRLAHASACRRADWLVDPGLVFADGLGRSPVTGRATCALYVHCGWARYECIGRAPGWTDTALRCRQHGSP